MICRAAVILLNVLSFYDPLRQLIQNGVEEGYINPSNEKLILFVDGPAAHDEHENFDWGIAALMAIEKYQVDDIQQLFNWRKGTDGSPSASLSSV